MARSLDLHREILEARIEIHKAVTATEREWWTRRWKQLLKRSEKYDQKAPVIPLFKAGK